MKIPSKWQETFDKKMLDKEFSQKVNILREAKQVQKEFLRLAEDDNESGSGRRRHAIKERIDRLRELGMTDGELSKLTASLEDPLLTNF